MLSRYVCIYSLPADNIIEIDPNRKQAITHEHDSKLHTSRFMLKC